MKLEKIIKLGVASTCLAFSAGCTKTANEYKQFLVPYSDACSIESKKITGLDYLMDNHPISYKGDDYKSVAWASNYYTSQLELSRKGDSRFSLVHGADGNPEIIIVPKLSFNESSCKVEAYIFADNDFLKGESKVKVLYGSEDIRHNWYNRGFRGYTGSEVNEIVNGKGLYVKEKTIDFEKITFTTEDVLVKMNRSDLIERLHKEKANKKIQISNAAKLSWDVDMKYLPLLILKTKQDEITMRAQFQNIESFYEHLKTRSD